MKDNIRFYIVGGAVRDSLLKKEPHDYDIVVEGATPEIMKDLGFIQVGKSFPVFLHPITKMEFALCRKEVKTGDKHTDFEFIWNGVSINEDLDRRDFTMNAMACQCNVDIETGKITPITLDKEKTIEKCYIIDNYNGFQDLHNGIIKAVNPDHFIEDPLRVLRACRFAAQLNFDIDPFTMILLQNMVNDGMLNHLSRDRIDTEMLKAMQPGFCSDKFILLMKECGALKQLYPEIYALFDNEENVKYHATGNTGLHVMAALRYAKDFDIHIKMASLYHDIYKPIAYKEKTISGEYVPHDSDNAIKYFEDMTKNKRYPYRIKQTIKLAIRYHMILWRFFDGMAAKTFMDLIGEITKDFNESYEYLLDELLLVCASDDNSDKTEECILRGQTSDRIERLSKVTHYIFDTCSKIKFRDILNYKELAPEKVKEKQRLLRIDLIKEEYTKF